MYQEGTFRGFFELDQMLRFLCATLLLASFSPACAAPERTADLENVESLKASPKDPVTNRALPLNQRFPSLDAYLLYLQNVEGPSDGVWYKQIRPGVYEMQTNARKIHDAGEAPEKRVFTREELMEKFGFTK